ncbi:MEDS domain-containing protein [Natrialbaceae archaeon GCM10025810]|uniref:MEDS domain-containing protein n=1 Tax=Halovalidus salilacus TaxID=3075124 RepID=UPI0036180408
MSKPISPTTDDVLSLGRPLEALQASPDFRGPVESLEGEYCNDHFALIYESREEQFATVIPFLRQGLERGEHCLYAGAPESIPAVRRALAEEGIDVEAAVDAGSLAFATFEETYLEGGSFDTEKMMETYAEAIEETSAEYEAFRLAAEMSWILDGDVPTEECMAYESRVNEIFDGEDAIAVCQYDRREFPAEVLCNVVRVHPHLISDTTVCHNFYYVPPEEFCGPNQPEHELDRMLGTLRSRTEAKVELQEREESLRSQYEITADPGRSFEEKLQAMFDLGIERFDLELGGMARVDPEADRCEIEYTSGDHDDVQPGVILPLSETFCEKAVDGPGAVSVTDPDAEGYEHVTVRRNFGFETYLGTFIEVDGGPDRTFFFVSSERRRREFTPDEYTFHRLMGQWLKYELEGRQRERDLERTIDRLEKSNQRLEGFAYAASHDLQEPLRMVSSYLQLVESRADEELSEECQEFLAFAVDGADRMRDMIEGLLAYSRVETRGDPFEPIDLELVLDDVLEDLSVRIEETDATISSGSLPRLEADGNQLRQVFQNLVDNALKYCGDEPPRVHVDAERDDDAWVLSVRDEGIGIDPNDRERIFDVFDRLHGREQYPGTGIGLALCERIVERHGGEIWVDSEPGEGSTFSFTLPATN